MTDWPRTLTPSPPDPDRPDPLRGAAIVWTRPAEGNERMAEALAEAGAEVLLAPAIEFKDLTGRNIEHFLMSLDHLREWHGWLVLPSPTAVRHFAALLARLGLPPTGLAGVRLAVVGQGSAEALAEADAAADFIAPEPNGASLARALPAGEGTPVMILGSSQTREELMGGLRARRLRVQTLALYEPLPCPEGLRAIERILEERPEALLAAASPSAVDAVLGHLIERKELRDRMRWVAIGPTTLRRLTECGVAAGRMAQAPTPDAAGFIAAAADLLARPWPPEAPEA